MNRVLAICVVADDLVLNPRKPNQRSAIDKRPVSGPVAVRRLGVDGDHVCDPTVHGGVDQAVYAYSDHEADRWACELGRDLPMGWFGENLRVDGPTTDLVVGTRLRIGDTVELEVTVPRTPCAKFAFWSGEKQWVKRFTERGDVGTYLRVIEEGTVAPGDDVCITQVPQHGATVRDIFSASNPDRLRTLLTVPDLPAKVQWGAERALSRAE